MVAVLACYAGFVGCRTCLFRWLSPAAAGLVTLAFCAGGSWTRCAGFLRWLQLDLLRWLSLAAAGLVTLAFPDCSWTRYAGWLLLLELYLLRWLSLAAAELATLTFAVGAVLACYAGFTWLKLWCVCGGGSKLIDVNF